MASASSIRRPRWLIVLLSIWLVVFLTGLLLVGLRVVPDIFSPIVLLIGLAIPAIGVLWSIYIIAVVRNRQARMGNIRCPRCGFDLQAHFNTSMTSCPECGATDLAKWQ